MGGSFGGVGDFSDLLYIRFGISTPSSNVRHMKIFIPQMVHYPPGFQIAEEVAIVHAWFAEPAEGIVPDEEEETLKSSMTSVCDIAMPRIK